ncbi:MAG: hypothetical protein Q7R64_01570 [bacterium]|nr:hypothetical protein [bacterium]
MRLPSMEQILLYLGGVLMGLAVALLMTKGVHAAIGPGLASLAGVGFALLKVR